MLSNMSLKQKIGSGLGALLIVIVIAYCLPLFATGKTGNNIAQLKTVDIPQTIHSHKLSESLLLAKSYSAKVKLERNYSDSMKLSIENVQKEYQELLKLQNDDNRAILEQLSTHFNAYQDNFNQITELGSQMTAQQTKTIAIQQEYISILEELRSRLGRSSSASQATDRALLITETIELVRNTPYSIEQIQASITSLTDKHNKIRAFADQYDMQTEFAKANELFQNLTVQLKNSTELFAKYNRIYAAIEADAYPLHDICLAFADQTSEHTKKILDDTSNSVSGIWVISIITLIILIAISIILMRLYIRMTIAPLVKVEEAINALSNGDLTHTVKVDSNDEIGHMAANINTMTQKVKDAINAIIVGSENIYSSSQEMSDTSLIISEGANKQSASTQEVTSAIEEMAATIIQTSDNAHTTEKIAENALKNIHLTEEASFKSMEAMKNIAHKISIIDEIAFQTNILALNAAVEAARAGEQGKGFAVVAAEVRKLAERSSKAASEIDNVSHGAVAVSENATELLKNIIPDIQKTTELVREIASACGQQTSGIQQVNQSMQQLNDITTQYAASAEEMAATSKHLATEGNILKESVMYFKTGIRETQQFKNKSQAQNTKKTAQQQNQKTSQPKQPNRQTSNTAAGITITGGNTGKTNNKTSAPRNEEFVMPTNKPVKKTQNPAPRQNAIEKNTGGTFIDMSNNDEMDNEFESF